MSSGTCSAKHFFQYIQHFQEYFKIFKISSVHCGNSLHRTDMTLCQCPDLFPCLLFSDWDVSRWKYGGCIQPLQKSRWPKWSKGLGAGLLGCPSLHLNQVTKLLICPIELHRVKINQLFFWHNQNTTSNFLGVDFDPWFRCKLGYPMVCNHNLGLQECRSRPL